MSLDMQTKELIAVSASLAGNCLPCLEWHCKKCMELKIPIEDIKEAIETARTVKGVPMKKIDELADNLIQQRSKK